MVYCAGMGIWKPAVIRAAVRLSSATPRMVAISLTASMSVAGQLSSDQGWLRSALSIAS